jgi:hypothetical protein
MKYYWISAENKLTQLDSSIYEKWVASNNPKAEYYTPISDPPGTDYYYDGSEWIQYPSLPVPPLTGVQFLSRFTDEELLAIEVLRTTAPDVETRAILTIYKESWIPATDIDVSDSRTLQRMTRLVELGLLTELRKNEILSI